MYRLGFGMTHAKVFKKNKHVNLINVSDIDLKKKITVKF